MTSPPVILPLTEPEIVVVESVFPEEGVFEED